MSVRKIKKWSKKQPAQAVVFVVMFAAIGTYMLFASYAATPTFSFEAEKSTINGNASVVSNSQASGGSALKFGTTSSQVQPFGDPLGRSWTSVLTDEFNGTSIDTSKWLALTGWGNNNVTSNPKNCTESGGNLILALPGDGTGCDLYSMKSDGSGPAGVNSRSLNVGDYLEARIWFPGPGTSPTATLDNWPAFWAYTSNDNNWLGGENDIAEAINNLQYNYHAGTVSNINAYSGNINPPGNWGNSWHVYGIYRDTSQVKIFYDGVLVGTQPTHDNGAAEGIMFNSGESLACCGAPTVHGAAGNVLVDWVRGWR
jgi:hypothetical protein